MALGSGEIHLASRLVDFIDLGTRKVWKLKVEHHLTSELQFSKIIAGALIAVACGAYAFHIIAAFGVVHSNQLRDVGKLVLISNCDVGLLVYVFAIIAIWLLGAMDCMLNLAFKRIKRSVGVVLFLALTPHPATAGEVFSVQCEGGGPARPHFATFDMEAKEVVFETPVLDAETNFGINALPGEIVSIKDNEIEFLVHASPGELDLIFALGAKTMTWPGLLAGTSRPKLVHQCTVTPPRSILSFRSRDPIPKASYRAL